VKILILGDIVGRPGRNFLGQHLAGIRSDMAIDLVLANGENAAGGAGITAKIAAELKRAGVDAITLGDHVWDQKNFENEIEDLNFVCRPANLPDSNPGRKHLILDMQGIQIGLFTVLGRTFMGPKVSCPFETSYDLIQSLQAQTDLILCEIHAEATSEKESMGWHLDGRVGMVYGTHTHVPTADGRILPKGTAYQSDLGMTGPRESVLGREIEACLGRFLNGMPRRCPVAEGDVGLQGCVIDFDPHKPKLPISYQRFEYRESDFEKTKFNYR